MANFYLSKNYIETDSAGNKAKTDVERILSKLGYKNAGLPQSQFPSKTIGFILTFIGVLKIFFSISKNDTVVIQYPFKKYYSFACNIIHLKKGKVITLIHDLGTFRRKRLSADQEIKRLNHSDVLIVHNYRMKDWLLQQGYAKPMVELEIWDYLSDSINKQETQIDEGYFKIIYAGALSNRKNKFLYSLKSFTTKWKFELYGKGFDESRINNHQHFKYTGFIPSDKLIENARAHFGLIWDGDSIYTCSSNFGEYLRINNPHKVSLYIRCNLPLIIWKDAALAKFITENKIGICVKSLDEIDKILPSISAESYDEMKKNIRLISEKLAFGFYFTKALREAEIVFLYDNKNHATSSNHFNIKKMRKQHAIIP